MKDEIKEILDEMINSNAYQDYKIYGKILIEIGNELLDYITNLQEENAKVHKELDYADNCNIYLISRIDKAIEYIKENMKDSQLVFGINDINRLYKKNMNDLLNILNGGDKDVKDKR